MSRYIVIELSADDVETLRRYVEQMRQMPTDVDSTMAWMERKVGEHADRVLGLAMTAIDSQRRIR